MNGLSVYLLSVVGVVILSSILNLLLENSKLHGYIKSVTSLILVFVIVSPLPKLLKSKIDLTSFLDETITFNENYKEVFSSQQKLTLEKNLEKVLSDEGFVGASVEVWADFENEHMKINYIFVDLSGLVLNTNLEHINEIEAIKSLLIKNTGVDEERVVFNV